MSGMSRKLVAEFIGTFWLVLGGCGAAVLAVRTDTGGIGALGVGLAFGLTVLTMLYAIGHMSGGHYNPAVSIGLWAARRFAGRDVLPYVVTQVVAAIAAAGVLAVIASGTAGFNLKASGFAANGYGDHSPGGYSLGAALLTEIVMTAAFVFVIVGATGPRAPRGFAPIAIGLTLTLIHLVSIPVTNASVNPARSTGPAVFVGGWALSQLWLFWLAPIVGAAVAGYAHGWLERTDQSLLAEGVPAPREGEAAEAAEVAEVAEVAQVAEVAEAAQPTGRRRAKR